MRLRHESPFLDQEALEFRREAEEDQETLRPAEEFLEAERYAEAEQLTEQQTPAPKRFRMIRQSKKVEAFELPEDQEAQAQEESFTAEAMESQDAEDFETASAEADDQLEATDKSESDQSATEWSADSDDLEATEDAETTAVEHDWEVQLEESERQDSELTVRPDPMPVPAKKPVPFAEPPAGSPYWPLATASPNGRDVSYRQADGTYVGRRPGRRFLGKRSNGKRAHTGVDLFARFNDAVVACEAGTVIAFYPFCCGPVKTSWALLVEHPGVVVNYGEVAPNSLARLGLKKGSRVQPGQVIAYVGKNPRGSSMLHFETWSKGTMSTKPWIVGRKRPDGLLNPTKYLLALQASASTVPQPQREIESPGSDPSRPTSDIVAFYAADDSGYESPFLSELDDED